MDRTDHSRPFLGAATLLLALTLPFAAVAVLRLYPALEIGAVRLTPPLDVIAAAAVAVVAAVVAVVHVAAGFTSGRVASIVLAGAFAMLAGGFGLEALDAIGRPQRSVAVGAAALLVLLAAVLASRGAVLQGRGRFVTAVAVFGGVEALLAALAFGPTLEVAAIEPARIVAGLALLLAAFEGRRSGLGAAALLLAAGTGVEAIARPETVETLVAHATFTGGLLTSRLDATSPRAAVQERPVAPRVAAVLPHEAAAVPPVVAPPSDLVDERSELARLGRELRATIEELMEARRTVELQRGELERAATVDPLTGVASRTAILERLRLEAAEARRYAHPLAVLLIDVDGFAGINRAHGTDAGDGVLRELALRMRLRVREADALGRSAGDAFLAILPHTDEAGAVRFADALRQRLARRPIVTETAVVDVSVSVGVAFMRAGEELDADRLLARAEEALASAQATGGDVIAFDRLHGLARIDGRREAPSAQDETVQDSGA